jgi:hypothetical protein
MSDGQCHECRINSQTRKRVPEEWEINGVKYRSARKSFLCSTCFLKIEAMTTQYQLPKDVLDEAKIQMTDNAIKFLRDNCPYNSPIRKPLTAILCENIDVDICQQILGFSKSFFRKLDETDTSIMEMKYKPNIKRIRVIYFFLHFF